jgi:hypothetical protein
LFAVGEPVKVEDAWWTQQFIEKRLSSTMSGIGGTMKISLAIFTGALLALSACSPDPEATTDRTEQADSTNMDSCLAICLDTSACTTVCNTGPGMTSTCASFNCKNLPGQGGPVSGGIHCNDPVPNNRCQGGLTVRPPDTSFPDSSVCYGAHFTNGAVRYGCNGQWVGTDISEPQIAPGFFGAIDSIGVWSAEPDVQIIGDAAGQFQDDSSWFDYADSYSEATFNITQRQSRRLKPSGNTGLHGIWGKLSPFTGQAPQHYSFQTYAGVGRKFNETIATGGDWQGVTYWSDVPIYAFRAYLY